MVTYMLMLLNEANAISACLYKLQIKMCEWALDIVFNRNVLGKTGTLDL